MGYAVHNSKAEVTALAASALRIEARFALAAE
jgi:hypothetical protein